MKPSNGLEPLTPSLPSIFGGGQARPAAAVYSSAPRFAGLHRAWRSPARFQLNDFEGVTRTSEREKRSERG
jgi:hypothetical protein